jgi:hypothetical protein
MPSLYQKTGTHSTAWTLVGGGVGGGVAVSASNSLYSSGTVVISGSGQLTASYNASTILLSVPQGASATGNLGGIAGSNTTFTNGTVIITGSNKITVKSGANSLIIDGGQDVAAIAGSNTTYTSGTVLFSGVGGGVTISSNTGQRIDISVAAPAGGTIDGFGFNTAALYSSTTNVMFFNSPHMNFLELPVAMQFNRILMPITLILSTAANTSFGFFDLSATYVLYTKTGVTLNPVVGSTSSTVYTWQSSTGAYTNLTGMRVLSFALQSTLTPGDYYFMYQISASNSGTGTNSTALSSQIGLIAGTLVTTNRWMAIGLGSSLTSYDPLFRLKGIVAGAITATSIPIQESQIQVNSNYPLRANNILIFEKT